MNKKLSTSEIIVIIFGALLVAWFAIIIAPYIEKGLVNVILNLNDSLSSPFSLKFCDKTLPTIAILLLMYVFALMVYYTSQGTYRLNEEYGSARWYTPQEINKKFKDMENEDNNMILSKHVRVSLDSYYTQMNKNTFVIGGSGSGKTRGYVYPNMMNLNSSFIVTDPKGEILRNMGGFLEENGYKVKVLNLIDHEKSLKYNPFNYIEKETDILSLIKNLMKNTQDKDQKSNDPFWDQASIALLQCIFLYLYNEANKEDQTFEMVMKMILSIEIDEDDPSAVSVFDILMEDLEREKPNCMCIENYKLFKSAAGKTAKSILVTTATRFATFAYPSIKNLTSTDELHLEEIGKEKCALFIIISDSDDAYNFLAGLLYTQLFQILYRQADEIYNGMLPVPVHIIMDEFANIALPDSFDKVESTMRSRNISVSIIVQAIAQVKALYKDNWETIIGNCNQIVYLGTTEQSTHEWVSKMLGKQTIDHKTYNKSSGSHGSYSTNIQKLGRELMMPEEVAKLKTMDCIVMLKDKVVFDNKFVLKEHKNYTKTYVGGAKPYEFVHPEEKKWDEIKNALSDKNELKIVINN